MPESKKKSTSWYEQKESARSQAPLKLTLFLVRFFPHWLLSLIAYPVSFFYWIASPKARTASSSFQKQLALFKAETSFQDNHGLKKTKVNTFLHIYSFALSLIEKFEGWCGKKKFSNIIYGDDDSSELKKLLAQKKGAVFIGCHLGNSELLRSFASFGETDVPVRVGVTIVADVKTTANFNNIISSLNFSSDMEVLSTEQIGAGTIEYLQQKIDGGNLVVLMGDRVSSANPERAIKEQFLGKDALFPYGTFLMASLLEAPVYYFFALRQKDITFSSKYDMIVERSRVQFIPGKKNRDLNLKNFCGEYVSLLQTKCLEHPFQWYNFFDFWKINGGNSL